MAELAEPDQPAVAKGPRRLLSGELRVLLMRLPSQERYALAWAMRNRHSGGAYGQPPNHAAVNGFYARLRLGAKTPRATTLRS